MCRMKKYLHQLPFATEADAILTDSADETKRGYSLYAELESPKLNSILAELQYVYRFAIKGESVGAPAYAVVDMFRGIPDDESTITEPFSLVRHNGNRVTRLNFEV